MTKDQEQLLEAEQKLTEAVREWLLLQPNHLLTFDAEFDINNVADTEMQDISYENVHVKGVKVVVGGDWQEPLMLTFEETWGHNGVIGDGKLTLVKVGMTPARYSAHIKGKYRTS